MRRGESGTEDGAGYRCLLHPGRLATARSPASQPLVRIYIPIALGEDCQVVKRTGCRDRSHRRSPAPHCLRGDNFLPAEEEEEGEIATLCGIRECGHCMAPPSISRIILPDNLNVHAQRCQVFCVLSFRAIEV